MLRFFYEKKGWKLPHSKIPLPIAIALSSISKGEHRIEVHFLPKYAPQANPIERGWWHLHEAITRNHRCQTLDELIDQAYEWFETNNSHYLDMRRSFARAA